jgi:hypothetical protein
MSCRRDRKGVRAGSDLLRVFIWSLGETGGESSSLNAVVNRPSSPKGVAYG